MSRRPLFTVDEHAQNPAHDVAATILVCDDDPSLRELVRAVLGPGYRFVEAADGTEALGLAREEPPDLIVLDVMLPGLSGIEVLEELRTDAELKEIPVVVITAWSHAEIDAQVAGADRFVSKPFDPDELSTAVEELLPVTLARRMWLASAALALLVGAAFTALILAVSAQREATDREARSKDISAESLQLERVVSDVESNFLSFAVDASGKSFRAYRVANDRLEDELEGLATLVQDDPSQRAKAQELETQIREWAFFSLPPLVGIIEEVPSIVKNDPTLTRSVSAQTDEIRRLFAGFRMEENKLAAEAARDADHRTDIAVLVGGVAVGASMALIALFGIVLARSIGRPVRAVADGANRIAGGELTLRLPEEGPGEVGELTRAFNEMAERLEVTHHELEEQNEELRESERGKTELVSIVSHELRTPLASVLGFTALLLKREFDPPTRRHYLGIVDAQARRLAALLEDFLDVQRIEHEGVDLAPEKIDLASLIDEQAQLYAAQSPKHELAVELAERPLTVRGDPGRLAQVVGNLLSNAIKYSPEGGTVQLVAARNGDNVRLAVHDEGLGIPEEQQSRIFTKFFRGDAGATGITGTGLGLAVSREIVEAHGGSIGFDSDPGEGTTFWLELPGPNGESSTNTTKEGE